MEKLISWLKWADDNLIKILLVGYIVVIPLAPKLPISTLEFTFVGIRFDDFYVALLAFGFLVQALRQKVNIRVRFALLFALFWASIFVSLYIGAFVLETFEYAHIGFLFAARRVEYMMVFFIAMCAIQSKKDFYFYLTVILHVMGVVMMYGIGQKLFGWPAVQTMNPEYAKGYILQLGAEARTSSTFAGHYDLAAYLVFLLPIVAGFYIVRKQTMYIILYIISVFTLTLTSSRISFGAYIMSFFPYLAWLRQYVIIGIALVITVVSVLVSGDLSERLKRTFLPQKVFVNVESGRTVIAEKIDPSSLPRGELGLKPIDQGKAVDEKDVTDEDIENAKQRLADIIIKEAEAKGEKISKAEIHQRVEEQFKTLQPIEIPLFDTSTSVRLKVTWPRALNAWLHASPGEAVKVDYVPLSILFGSGPSSVGEAADGNYFRLLAEFGLIGSILYLGILGSIAVYVLRYIWIDKPKDKALYWAFLFGLGGLMINATFIDVFEASKVAYTLWLVAGLYVGSILTIRKVKPLREKKEWGKKDR